MDFHEGFAIINIDGKYGFIDKTGQIAIPCIYDSVHCFNEGLAIVYKNGYIGFVDKTGKSSFDYK